MTTQNIVPFSQLTDYELTNKTQDIRGWAVKDHAGTSLGTVRELLVDTKAERVTSLVLDDGKTIPASDVSLGDRVVLLRAQNAGASAKGSKGGEQVIPVMEEFLRVGKRDVQAGHVRVETHVVSKPVEETVRLREEHVSVERRPVNREVTAADGSRLQGQTVEVTARSEEAVVAKTARIVEEIVVRKDATERSQTIRESVKHTEVAVEDSSSEYNPNAYKQHYASNQAQSGHAFEQFAPAYKFGHTMRSDSRFAGKSWNDVEPKAREAWEDKNPGTWEQFKEAVQQAWNKVAG